MIYAALLAAAGLITTQSLEAGALMPGVLDLPIVGNAQVIQDCGDMGRFGLRTGDQAVCLRTPDNCCHEALLNDYGRLSIERGWVYAIADGPRVYFQRPGSDGRCEQLTLGSTRTNGSTDRFDPYDAFVIVFRSSMSCG